MASLAVLFRPHTFEDVCGQASIIKILRKQLDSGNLSNTYIFSGPSGCGKTTMARIFAGEINKYQAPSGEWIYPTPIEIDGASNNGVDNVKKIIQDASERSIEGTYKIYIIDECHMLTVQAWNAFLKCIEEPPKYTIFIFCTTDPQKIPATIINRCMKFNFTRLSCNQIKTRLLYICEQTGHVSGEVEPVCEYIARISNGQARDAISMLEKCFTFDTVLSIDNALTALGTSSYQTMFDLLNVIIDCDEAQTLGKLNEIYNNGNDIKVFIDQFLAFVLDVMKYLLMKDVSITKLPLTMQGELERVIKLENAGAYYNYLATRILELKNMLKNDPDPLSTTTVKLLGVCRCQ